MRHWTWATDPLALDDLELTRGCYADDGGGNGGDGGGGNGGNGGNGDDFRLDKHPRFQEVLGQRNTARQELADTKAKLAEYEARVQRVDSLTDENKRLRDEGKAAKTRYAEDLALAGLGLVDDTARDIARLLHGKTSEEGRPPLADWVKSFTGEGAKDVPPALAGYLGAAPAGGGEAPHKSSNAGTSGNRAPATSGKADAARIKAIRDECVRTGDWGPWEEAKKNGAV